MTVSKQRLNGTLLTVYHHISAKEAWEQTLFSQDLLFPVWLLSILKEIYSDSTLEELHNPICSGFSDWEDYRALLLWRQNVSQHLSPGCYEQRKESDLF